MRLTGGTEVQVKPDRTKVNGQRNYALRAAADLIKMTPAASGKQVSIDWIGIPRAVKVNNTIAFEQQRDELKGSFRGEFSHLHLP